MQLLKINVILFLCVCSVEAAAPSESGPTVHLAADDQSEGNALGDFMYFVPLISPEAVTVLEKRGNAQRVKVLDIEKRVKDQQVYLNCGFSMRGEGFYRHVFDHSRKVDRLREGGSAGNLLGHIHFEGNGKGWVEAEGILSNGVAVINTVSLIFRGAGGPCPVSIGMHGVRRQQGEPVRFDEIRLEISTLAFKRSAHRPHMEVRVASIKDQHAGNGLWTNFKGAIKGMVANQFIPPVRIEQIGNDAVINFAQALYDGKREFTFPVAKNLIGERAVDALP